MNNYEALEIMCRRCINREACQGTGCTPKQTLSNELWHDLRKCPSDLPKYKVIKGLKGLSEGAESYLVRTSCGYEWCYYYGYWQDHRGYRHDDVIAWKDIEKVDEVI